MFLDRIRSSVAGPAAKVLIGLLAVSFALWGIGDVFGSGAGGAVAEVGGVEVPAQGYRTRLSALIQNFRARGRNLTLAEARDLGLDREVLGFMINNAALDAAARALSLGVSDDRVAEDILKDPAFRGPFGQFDRQTFKFLLVGTGISEADYAEQRRRQHMRGQLAGAVRAHSGPPPLLARQLWAWQNERRAARYVLLPPDFVEKPEEPDDAALAKFIQRNPSLFIVPETRDFELLALDPARLLSDAAIAPEEIAAEYEARKSSFVTPERRETDQITFADAAEAAGAAERIRAGAGFEEIAGARGLSQEDIALGSLSRGEFLSPALAEAAFALKENEVSAPVEGPLGPVLLRVRKIDPAGERALRDVAGKIRRALLLDKARDEIAALHDLIEDARAGGETLEEIAQRFDMTLLRIAGMRADGVLGEGSVSALPPPPGGLAELPEIAGLVDRVFTSGEGEELDPGLTGNGGYYWLSVARIGPARILDLEEARGEARALWRRYERRERLEAAAQALAARGNGGERFEALLSGTNRAPVSTPPVTRFATSEVFSEEAVDALFSLAEGGFASAPAELGEGVVLLQLERIERAGPDDENARIGETQEELRASFSDELLAQYIAGLRESFGVEVYEDSLRALLEAGLAPRRPVLQ